MSRENEKLKHSASLKGCALFSSFPPPSPVPVSPQRVSDSAVRATIGALRILDWHANMQAFKNNSGRSWERRLDTTRLGLNILSEVWWRFGTKKGHSESAREKDSNKAIYGKRKLSVTITRVFVEDFMRSDLKGKIRPVQKKSSCGESV